MRVRLRGGRLLRLGHLGAQALELLVERGLVGEQRRELLVALAQSPLPAAAAAPRSASAPPRAAAAHAASKPSPGAGRLRARVGAREPVATWNSSRTATSASASGIGAVAVHSAVAERVDHPRLAEHRLARRLLEARLVDQRGEVVLVGQPERRVVLVRPAHRQLQRAAGVEARRARVRMDSDLGPGGRIFNRRPLVAQKLEIGGQQMTLLV